MNRRDFLKGRLGRWYNRVYAFIGDRVWKPCPICGEMFGDHERASTRLEKGWRRVASVCHGCGPEAQRRNAERLEQHTIADCDTADGEIMLCHIFSLPYSRRDLDAEPIAISALWVTEFESVEIWRKVYNEQA